jgi:hypothetical protein
MEYCREDLVRIMIQIRSGINSEMFRLHKSQKISCAADILKSLENKPMLQLYEK